MPSLSLFIFGTRLGGKRIPDQSTRSLSNELTENRLRHSSGPVHANNHPVRYINRSTFFSTFISTSSDEDQSNLAQHFPNFVWAVRDHHLKLEIEGKEVTANDYLEFCLKFKPGS